MPIVNGIEQPIHWVTMSDQNWPVLANGALLQEHPDGTWTTIGGVDPMWSSAAQYAPIATSSNPPIHPWAGTPALPVDPYPGSLSTPVMPNPAPVRPAQPAPAPAPALFPPSSSWLNLIMGMMPPRPAPPRPISTIFNPTSWAPATSAFPGGTSQASVPAIQADVTGSQIKTDQGLNDTTSKAMTSNEAHGRQAALQYANVIPPQTRQGSYGNAVFNELMPQGALSTAPVSYIGQSYNPWILPGLDQSRSVSRTGK